jgi:hypothetical protein
MYIHKQLHGGGCTACTQMQSLYTHNSNAYVKHIRNASKLMYYICVYIVCIILFFCVSLQKGVTLTGSFTRFPSATDNEVIFTKVVLICFITIERVLYLTGVEIILPVVSDFLDIHIKHRSNGFLESARSIHLLRMVWFTFEMISWYIRLQCILWGVWYFVFCICIQLAISYFHVEHKARVHPRVCHPDIFP